MTLDQWKTLTDIAQGVTAIIAIGVGGTWTYWKFIKGRGDYPRAAVSHRIHRVDLPSGHTLLRIENHVSNTGERLLELRKGFTRLLRILPPDADVLDALANGDDPVPCPGTEVPWPEVSRQRDHQFDTGTAEVEPGESEVIEADFFLPPDTKVALVYSYFWNEKKQGRDIGWPRSTLVDLRRPDGDEALKQETTRKPTSETLTTEETETHQLPPKPSTRPKTSTAPRQGEKQKR
jgi:hypothetical protein